MFSSRSSAQEYEPWTGSVVGASINFGNHDTLIRIRKLINEGKVIDAVRESEKFINNLNTLSRSGKTSKYLYDAYNALCISLTANNESQKATQACNAAIEDTPNRWQAFNSRGSMNYRNGSFSAALADYRQALENAPDVTHIRRIIEHNVRISEARVSGN
ncbi:MAG: tetratricopeptide repeat protein [Emcibacteraceae bacterium]|nr:tetratricopeptide repeat protein [Emcibacteraceae bacterium]